MKFLIDKPVTIVLVWTIFISLALFWNLDQLLGQVYRHLIKNISDKLYSMLVFFPPAVLLFTIPLSGYLADSRFGNFKVFRAGCVLLFLGSVLVCVCVLVVTNLNTHASLTTAIVIGPLSILLSIAGGSICVVTVFQLGLDQMPDASSAGITVYIILFFMALPIGLWVSSSLYPIKNCTVDYGLSIQVMSLLPALCMCILLSSLLSHWAKLLIIQPKSPKSLRNIYRVLKFAAKHKAPLNRSALTYWEEDIPSRLDLGKSRYGGPFTTEQVEDVKTLFRMLLVFLPVWIVILSTNIFGTLDH